MRCRVCRHIFRHAVRPASMTVQSPAPDCPKCGSGTYEHSSQLGNCFACERKATTRRADGVDICDLCRADRKTDARLEFSSTMAVAYLTAEPSGRNADTLRRLFEEQRRALDLEIPEANRLARHAALRAVRERLSRPRDVFEGQRRLPGAARAR